MASFPISTVVPPSGTYSSSAEVEEDNNDGIISNVRCMQAKRKVVLAMGEAVTGAPKATKRVQMRRGFARLLRSISSTPVTIIVLPHDDVQ